MMPAGGPPPALTPSPPPPPITTLSDPASSSSSSSSSSSRGGGSWLYSSLPPLLMHVLKACFPRSRPYLPFSEFLAHARDGKLQSVLMGNSNFEVRMKPTAGGSNMGKATPQVYQTQVVPHVDRGYILELLQQQQISFGTLAPSWGRKLLTLLIAISPFLYLALVYRMMNKMYNPTDSVGKEHRTQKSKKNKRLITFKDVAGIDQAKLELVEIVSFLRDRTRYDEIGARLPKGILLSGPPGTGKTLLARALANEAGCTFISCSASDFVELLVGRGAARVRDIFQRAFDNSPAILFIDELDALGRARGGFSSNDEREQTLNQLLTEMDGFEPGEENTVLVIAATNRPEVLDAALVRPGRFDRHVSVGFPDTRGRKGILQVHTRHTRLAPDVDLQRLSTITRGYSGAELSNVVNEACLLAVRAGLRHVTQPCFLQAVERNNQSRKLASTLDENAAGSPGSGMFSPPIHFHHHHVSQNNNNNNGSDFHQSTPLATP